jgi:hypothetical protein
MIEGGLDAIFNPVASNIEKWRIFIRFRLLRHLHHLTWDHETLCACRYSKNEQLSIKSLSWEIKNTNMAGG